MTSRSYPRISNYAPALGTGTTRREAAEGLTITMKRLNEEPVKSEEVSRIDANGPAAKRINLLRSRMRSNSSPGSSRASPRVDASPAREVPNYKPSGILKEDAEVKGLAIMDKYTEPEDRSDPPAGCHHRLYTFKDHDDILDTIQLDHRSFYLLGSAPESDIRIEHESAAPQHAALQFRKPDADGPTKLYILDLASPSGIQLNGKRIPSMRYVEVLAKDSIRVGSSPTEYLLIDDA